VVSRDRVGRADPVCPVVSHVDLLGDCQGVIDLDAEVAHRALNPIGPTVRRHKCAFPFDTRPFPWGWVSVDQNHNYDPIWNIRAKPRMSVKMLFAFSAWAISSTARLTTETEIPAIRPQRNFQSCSWRMAIFYSTGPTALS